MNFKRKVNKMRRKLLPLQLNAGCDFQDSMCLIKRKRTRPTQAKPNQIIANDFHACTSIAQETATGMSTLCMIRDGGLDPTTDSDSSIEEVREACSTMPTESHILPDIIIDKPGEGTTANELDDTLHLNIKNSTMNQSAVAADIDEMQNLSPINSKSSKKKMIQLLDVGDQAPSSNFVSCEASAASEYLSTGNTPKHIKAVMNKLRSLGKKKKSDILQPDTDVNHNSINLSEAKAGEENTGNGQEEDSEEWSPTKMPRKPLGTKNWLQNNEVPISTYLCPDIIPAWKKAIMKPQEEPCQMSFRTSSPSPYHRKSSILPAKDDKPLFQISSIRECDADVSIDINFDSLPKHTINSDEIAAFSTLDGEFMEMIEQVAKSDDNFTMPELKQPDDIDLPEIIASLEEAPPLPEINIISSPSDPLREFKHVKSNQSPPACLTRPSYKEGEKSPINNPETSNISVESDIIPHLPSPRFNYKQPGTKAPNYSHIPNDEICNF